MRTVKSAKRDLYTPTTIEVLKVVPSSAWLTTCVTSVSNGIMVETCICDGELPIRLLCRLTLSDK